MRTRFRHYVPLSDQELSALWNTAIITVDTNVLLDLYRYHEETRDALLASLARFTGRLWLSHQAAEEFFHNRHVVIAAGQKGFDEALGTLADFDKAIATLRGNRVVPRAAVDALQSNVRDGVEAARGAINNAKNNHPNYFEQDPVLERILSLFDGGVGPEPSAEEMKQLHAEAARRLQEKIPPGYRDSAKGDSRAYGDYCLWRQILAHAKEKASPMLLVTSERKDDWWEKIEGRRLGLRRELREEAAREAGQLILLYEREHFMTESARRFQVAVSPEVIRDIRALERNHKMPASDSELDELVESVLDRASNDLVDSEEVSSCIAVTNASGFYPYQVEVSSAGPLSLEDATIPFEATIYFEGDQNEDQTYCGDKITAVLTGSIVFDGAEWRLVDGYDLHAEVDYDEPDEPDDDAEEDDEEAVKDK
jgi:hypothetical protein